MDFYVIFYSKSNACVSAHRSRELGLDDVDAIRNDCGYDVDINIICNDYEGLEKSVEIILKISEEQARKSGLFKKTTFLRVSVQRLSLTRYYEETFVYAREDGVLTGVELKYKLNKEKLYQDWEYFGFPTDWRGV